MGAGCSAGSLQERTCIVSQSPIISMWQKIACYTNNVQKQPLGQNKNGGQAAVQVFELKAVLRAFLFKLTLNE